MRPRIMRIIAAVLVLVVCRAAVDQARATVVRDGRAGSGNPSVEAGGHPVAPGKPPLVPYSLIGAVQAESQWWIPNFTWPWRMFGSFGTHRRHSERFRETWPDNRSPHVPRLP